MALYVCTTVCRQRSCGGPSDAPRLEDIVDIFSVGDECLWAQGRPLWHAATQVDGRSRASVAVTPMSRQISWTQVADGRPQVRLHSCKGRSPSLVLVQIQRIWFAGTSTLLNWQPVNHR